MSSFNKVILMGNLVADPEMRYTPNGTAICEFNFAVNRKVKGEEKDEVCFIGITVFGKQAENCSQYLKKGQQVIIDGRLDQQRWINDDNQKRSKHRVVANNVTFMGKKQGNGGG